MDYQQRQLRRAQRRASGSAVARARPSASTAVANEFQRLRRASGQRRRRASAAGAEPHHPLPPIRIVFCSTPGCEGHRVVMYRSPSVGP